MSRLCQPKCWKMLHIIFFHLLESILRVLCLLAFMIKRCFSTICLHSLILNIFCAMHLPATPNAAGPWPVFQVFYELHSGFRLNLKIWSGQGAKMTGTPLKVPWPQETWNCWYREWPAIFQPRLPADMNHPHTSHSKSQQKLASENSISTPSIQPVSWIWFPKVG